MVADAATPLKDLPKLCLKQAVRTGPKEFTGFRTSMQFVPGREGWVLCTCAFKMGSEDGVMNRDNFVELLEEYNSIGEAKQRYCEVIGQYLGGVYVEDEVDTEEGPKRIVTSPRWAHSGIDPGRGEMRLVTSVQNNKPHSNAWDSPYAYSGRHSSVEEALAVHKKFFEEIQAGNCFGVYTRREGR